MFFLGLHQNKVLGVRPRITTYGKIIRQRGIWRISETLTNGGVKLLTPSFCALVVGSTREKVRNLVPLASVSPHSFNELNVLGVRPTTCRGIVLGATRIDVIDGNMPLRRDGSRE